MIVVGKHKENSLAKYNFYNTLDDIKKYIISELKNRNYDIEIFTNPFDIIKRDSKARFIIVEQLIKKESKFFQGFVRIENEYEPFYRKFP